jgi:hypothetical protein
MELHTNKIDDAVLALLYLGLHDGARAWKGFDWEAMNRLHGQGNITDPRGKAKSVVFTEEGLERAKRLLEELFTREAEQTAPSTDLRRYLPRDEADTLMAVRTLRGFLKGEEPDEANYFCFSATLRIHGDDIPAMGCHGAPIPLSMNGVGSYNVVWRPLWEECRIDGWELPPTFPLPT